MGLMLTDAYLHVGSVVAVPPAQPLFALKVKDAPQFRGAYSRYLHAVVHMLPEAFV